MSSFPVSNPQWRDQLLAYLPLPVRTLLQGASGRDLIKKIEATVLLRDGKLFDLESRKSLPLAQGNNAEALAKACRALLGEERKEQAVLLLLPASEFVATTVHIPGISKESLIPALKIQANSILPSFEESLSLAINPKSAEYNDEHIALWISEKRQSDLFAAFAEQGVFLAAIKPGLLNLGSIDEGALSRIVDDDATSVTCAVLNRGVLQKWLQVNKRDLEQDYFQQQWQKASASDESNAKRIELNSEQDYFDLTDKNSGQDYCFFPRGALDATRRAEKGKRYIAAVAAAISLLFIAAIPFIAQSLEFRSLAASLEAQRQMSSTARDDQAAVVSFENQWGLINDFPEQRIRDAMFTLQNLLSPDVLTSLEVSEGLIKIQGTSAEPQAILQRLEQDPMFTEVIFSRATNNSRYYIDLRLSTVNFEGYMVRYFPDE
ncbi:MAG: hypothetical protein HQ498_05615 [Pseudohongiella sp.]|nr:hypothetical protein [Pseudohongiella sp.]